MNTTLDFPRSTEIEAPTRLARVACFRCGGSGQAGPKTVFQGRCFRCLGLGIDPKLRGWAFPATWTDAECKTWDDAREAKNARARELAAEKKADEKLAVLRENYELHEGFQDLHEAFLAADETDPAFHGAILFDIFQKAYTFVLSEAQVSLVKKIVTENVDRAQGRAQEEDSKIEIPSELLTDRVEIAGELLKAEWRDSQFGSALKGLLKVSTDDGHFLLWGTIPSSITEAERGDWVVFTARISVSDDDKSFGFWSRPSKARIEA